jgi:deoxycytidylate deaminase
MIINAGIVRIVASKDYHASTRSKEILIEAGVQLEILDDTIENYHKKDVA